MVSVLLGCLQWCSRADCLSPPFGWPSASTMCLLAVHCPRTLLSNSSHAVVLDAQGLPALMAILPRLCSSCSGRYLRMSFGRCSEESTVPLEMLFPQRRCSQFFPSSHGWCCSESFQGILSMFCLDFMALLRNKKCFSPTLIKITGIQAFRWESGNLLSNCYYIKGREKRIDSWSVILLTSMLWRNKLCFCLLSKLLWGLTTQV